MIPVFFTSVFLFVGFRDPSVIKERVETLTLDFRFQLRNLFAKPKAHNDIVIVDIDEKSISRYGRWPWTRGLQARLIEEILKGNPRALGVDIFWSEPEDEEADSALLEALRKGEGRVVIAATFEDVQGAAERAPDSEFLLDSAFVKIKDLEAAEEAAPKTYRALLMPEFAGAAAVGHVYSPPDRDGKLRWECLYVMYDGEFYPSLALYTVAVSMGKTVEDMTIYGGKGVSAGNIFIPTDFHGRVLVNYPGGEASYRRISAGDVLGGGLSGGVFDEKIALIGTSAIGTYDMKATPFSANMPGVVKNAAVIDNILTGRFLREDYKSFSLLVTLLMGIVLGIALPRMNALKAVLFSAGLMALYLLVVQARFTYGLRWLNLFYPAANAFSISIALIVSKYLFEEKRARELRHMFSSYVSPKIVEELIRNPEKARLGGERRTVTVLFSDVAGFTSLSEKMQPEEVVAMLNEYFKEMADIIFRWDGTLDKFVGDEIMAFWGAPAEQPAHAELAVRCALHMSKKLDELRAKWLKEGKPSLEIGIGINTGEVLIGNIGAEGKKMDYTIIGDHVNIGARVEALTRKYGTRVLITENTFNFLRSLIERNAFGHLKVVDLASVRVKGKEQEIRIFEIKDKDSEGEGALSGTG